MIAASSVDQALRAVGVGTIVFLIAWLADMVAWIVRRYRKAR